MVIIWDNAYGGSSGNGPSERHWLYMWSALQFLACGHGPRALTKVFSSEGTTKQCGFGRLEIMHIQGVRKVFEPVVLLRKYPYSVQICLHGLGVETSHLFRWQCQKRRATKSRMYSAPDDAFCVWSPSYGPVPCLISQETTWSRSYLLSTSSLSELSPPLRPLLSMAFYPSHVWLQWYLSLSQYLSPSPSSSASLSHLYIHHVSDLNSISQKLKQMIDFLDLQHFLSIQYYWLLSHYFSYHISGGKMAWVADKEGDKE